MLVASGQPVEVVRFLQNVQGQPFDPATKPTATAQVVVGLPDAPTGSVSCTVRKTDQGTYAARLPGSLVSDLARLRVSWSWTDDAGDQVKASDDVEVTTVPVCSLADLDRLPGDDKARVIEPSRKLRAISQATRAFESATNRLFSPRIAREVLAYPGPVPSMDDIGGDLTVVVEPDAPSVGLATYTYVTGRPQPPEDVSRAVAILASSLMTDGPWDDRGMAVSDDAGTIRLLTQGVGGAMSSIPEVEATIRRYRQPVVA